MTVSKKTNSPSKKPNNLLSKMVDQDLALQVNIMVDFCLFKNSIFNNNFKCLFFAGKIRKVRSTKGLYNSYISTFSLSY